MEVLRQPEPAMMFMHQGGNSRAPALYPHHSPKMLTCYGFDAATLAASRTPTPEHRVQSCSPPAPCPSSCASPHSSSPPSSSSGALYSVLMGCVPKAYSLMASSPPNSSSAYPPSSCSSSSSSTSSSSYAMPSAAVSTAPCHERMEEDDAQTEPMDLSCKRPNFPSSSSSSSSHSAFSSSSSSSSCHSQQGHEFSLLRELLCKGKGEQAPSSSSTFSSAASTSSSSPYSSGISGSVSPARSASSPRCDSPDSEKSSDSFFSRPAAVVTGSTRVTLAKKNMFPVCSRVSDLLYKVIHFTKSIPEFMTLSHNDKVTLILNSWSKLLLLFMAEGNFHFVVTPIFSSDQQSGGEQDCNPSAGEPTMRGVENIQAFLRKCQQMNLDGKEYAFLKMLVLFNSSYVGLDRPDQVEQLNSVVQHLLKQHVDSRGLEDFMHFSKLLLGLPSLYSIDSKMVENLFCKHIAKSADMEVLLKEMLQSEQ